MRYLTSIPRKEAPTTLITYNADVMQTTKIFDKPFFDFHEDDSFYIPKAKTAFILLRAFTLSTTIEKHNKLNNVNFFKNNLSKIDYYQTNSE